MKIRHALIAILVAIAFVDVDNAAAQLTIVDNSPWYPSGEVAARMSVQHCGDILQSLGKNVNFSFGYSPEEDIFYIGRSGMVPDRRFFQLECALNQASQEVGGPGFAYRPCCQKTNNDVYQYLVAQQNCARAAGIEGELWPCGELGAIRPGYTDVNTVRAYVVGREPVNRFGLGSMPVGSKWLWERAPCSGCQTQHGLPCPGEVTARAVRGPGSLLHRQPVGYDLRLVRTESGFFSRLPATGMRVQGLVSQYASFDARYSGAPTMLLLCVADPVLGAIDEATEQESPPHCDEVRRRWDARGGVFNKLLGHSPVDAVTNWLYWIGLTEDHEPQWQCDMAESYNQWLLRMDRRCRRRH